MRLWRGVRRWLAERKFRQVQKSWQKAARVMDRAMKMKGMSRRNRRRALREVEKDPKFGVEILEATAEGVKGRTDRTNRTDKANIKITEVKDGR